ncbi:MAG: hypothetical protein C5B48_02300, partial [Candidatus Rokuibacteriota bacterium]
VVVGVRELKTRLASYLRQVRRGQTIVVTDRGEPVAELRPIALAKSNRGAELDRLVAPGHLTRTSQAPLGPFRPIRLRGPLLSDAIVQDREDRF